MENIKPYKENIDRLLRQCEDVQDQAYSLYQELAGVSRQNLQKLNQLYQKADDYDISRLSPKQYRQGRRIIQGLIKHNHSRDNMPDIMTQIQTSRAFKGNVISLQTLRDLKEQGKLNITKRRTRNASTISSQSPRDSILQLKQCKEDSHTSIFITSGEQISHQNKRLSMFKAQNQIPNLLIPNIKIDDIDYKQQTNLTQRHLKLRNVEMPKSPRLKRFIRKIPKFLGEDYTKERKDTLKLLEMEKIIQETTRKEQKNGFLPKSPHRY